MAPAIRERRCPSHAVPVAMKSRINDTNVIQKPDIHKLVVPRKEKERSWRPYLARERQHREPAVQGGPDVPDVLYHAR
jgi:hypothetical protein